MRADHPARVAYVVKSLKAFTARYGLGFNIAGTYLGNLGNGGETLRLDDAAWVGYRLAEVLPLDANVKQALLELTDAGVRLERLRSLLVKQGLGTSRSEVP